MLQVFSLVLLTLSLVSLVKKKSLILMTSDLFLFLYVVCIILVLSDPYTKNIKIFSYIFNWLYDFTFHSYVFNLAFAYGLR